MVYVLNINIYIRKKIYFLKRKNHNFEVYPIKESQIASHKESQVSDPWLYRYCIVRVDISLLLSLSYFACTNKFIVLY